MENNTDFPIAISVSVFTGNNFYQNQLRFQPKRAIFLVFSYVLTSLTRIQSWGNLWEAMNLSNSYIFVGKAVYKNIDLTD